VTSPACVPANKTPDNPPQDCALDQDEDIYGALRSLVLLQAPVRVLIDDQTTAFCAQITDVQLNNRSFFMTRLQPDKGNDLIRQGKRFRIDCDNQGIRIRFVADGRLRYQSAEQQYRGEFPSQVEYLQRRDAYRVNVPAAHYLVVEIPDQHPTPDEQTAPRYRYKGRLQDLSESGFKACFEGDIQADLKQLNLIAAAIVRCNEQHYLDCGLELRHLMLDSAGNTLAGFVFTRISSAARRYIYRLTTDFQWEERQFKIAPS
jgi:c-di-GMP-binding flagellar brake protein YcgR|tara:strand:+ start:1379 stop:2158 length:780 start_codon:yes stop_codon:yes gene_type:complete